MPRKVNRKRKEKIIQSDCYSCLCSGHDDAVFKPCSPPPPTPPPPNTIIEIFKKNPYLIVFAVLAIDKIVSYIKPYYLNTNNA